MIFQKSLHFLKPYKRCIWISADSILAKFVAEFSRHSYPVIKVCNQLQCQGLYHMNDMLPSNQNYYLRVVSESDSCGTNLDMTSATSTQATDGAHNTVITNERTDNSVSSSGKLHSKMPCLPTRSGTSLTSHTLCKMCGLQD